MAPLGGRLGGAGSDGALAGGPTMRPGEPTGTIALRDASGATLSVATNCDHVTRGLDRHPSGTSIPNGGSYESTVGQGSRDVHAGDLSGQIVARDGSRLSAGGLTVLTVT